MPSTRERGGIARCVADRRQASKTEARCASSVRGFAQDGITREFRELLIVSRVSRRLTRPAGRLNLSFTSAVRFE